MTLLERQVGLARRRLTTNVLMHHAARGVLIGACLWILAVRVDRELMWGLRTEYIILAGALVAVAFTAIGTLASRVAALHAAVVIDKAAGLKERVSSALAVQRESDAFAQAVVRDANKIAGRIHVPSHVPYRAPARWPYAACAIAAAIILSFVPGTNLLAADDNAERVAQRDMAKEEREGINRDFEEHVNKLKQLAENNPALADLAKDLKPLDMPDSPSVKPEDIRRDALKKLDKVTDRLAQEKDNPAVDALKDTKRILSQLEPERGENPAAELSKSLASGDFKGAKKALESLQEELKEAAAKGDQDAQQQLAKMQQQLKRLADQLSELDDSLYLQKELENKAGLTEEQARKLAEQLSKMDPKQIEKELQQRLGDKGMSQKQIKELAKRVQQQQKAKKACQNMGQCMAQAAQALQQCQTPGSGSGASQAASAALSDAMSQMSEMEMSEQFLAELEAQMSDLRQLRDSVCQGNCCKGDCMGQSDRQPGSQLRGAASARASARSARRTTFCPPRPTRAFAKALSSVRCWWTARRCAARRRRRSVTRSTPPSATPRTRSTTTVSRVSITSRCRSTSSNWLVCFARRSRHPPRTSRRTRGRSRPSPNGPVA